MSKTIIYLIRHSKAMENEKEFTDTIDAQIENERIILSDEGEKLAEELSLKVELQNIDVLYSSNYTRAISTAKYIAKQNNIEINTDERLGERKLRKFRRIKEIR